MITAVVIVHPRLGVYIGHAIGMAYWTLLDTAGQPWVATFENETQAREHVASWDGDHSIITNDFSYCVVEPDTKEIFASARALRKAGLGHLVGDLEMQELHRLPIAGSA